MPSGFDVVVRDRISVSIENKLNRIEASAQRAATAILAMQGSMGGLAGGLNSVGGSAQNATSRILAFALGLGRAQTNAQLLVGSVRSTGQALRAFASGILLLGATGGIIEEVDSYRTLQNQLRTTTSSQAELNEVTRQMFEIAQRARVPVDSISTAFTRYDKALTKLGFGTQETLDLTETIAKAFVLSGSSATEASSGLTQLSQAFNKGKLDGDEFRTTAELFPGLLDALATAFGKPRSEIFKLSKDGAITVDILIKAFKILKEQVDADFANTPRTIGQAFTQLGNTVKKAFGEFDQKTGFTDKITSFIDSIGNNLPTVVNWLKAFGAAAAVMILPSVIALLGPVTSFFLTVPGLIAAAAAVLAFFSDEIKVTGDGVTTLTDLLGVLVTNFKQIISAVSGFSISGYSIDTIFSAEGAQKLYDAIVSVSGAILTGIQNTIAWTQAMKEFFLAASFKGQIDPFDEAKGGGFTLDFLFEPVNLLIENILNRLNEIAISIVRSLETPIRSVIGLLDNLQKAFGAILQLLASITPFSGKLGLQPLIDALNVGMGDSSSQKMIDKLDSMKFDTSKAVPQLTKGIEAFDKTWESSMERMKDSSKNLYDDIIKQAQEAAQKRIALEEKVAEANKANPSVLRQDDPVLRQQLAQESELRRFSEALDDVSKKSAMVRAVMAQNSVFADEFKLKTVQGALAAEGFSESIIKMGLGLKSLKPELQAVGTGVEAFKKAASVGAPGNQSSPTQNNAATLQATSAAFQTVTANATSTTTAIQSVMFAITEIDSTAQTMSASVTGAFQSISAAASISGGEIAATISASMNAASASVSGFASSAIADFQAVANAANSIQVPGGGGGGGFFGFASGGYTGNGGVNEIAGVVHGKEFVMPAGPTAQYLPILEAMRSGRSLPSAGGSASSVGNSLNVTVQNYGSSKISVERLSESDIRIIAREEATRTVSSESPRIVASQLRNPNSTVSKSLARNTKSERRR